MPTPHAPLRDRLYQSQWQDGLLDLTIGVTLLGLGLGWLFDAAAISAVIPAVAVPLWQAARNRWITPRLGYVKFDVPRRRQLSRGHGILLGLGGLGFIAATAAAFSLPLGESTLLDHLVPGLPALLLAFGGFAAGVLFALPRLLVYAGVTVLLAVGTAVCGLHPGWPLLGSGVVPAVVGAILLARFFRDFPILTGELE